MSNVALAASLPAMLWNQMPVLSGWVFSTAACTSMWDRTQCGRTVGEAKGGEQVLQGPLDRRDRRRIAGDGVGAEHHVAHGVGQAVEDLPVDVADVVGRRVGLNRERRDSPAPRSGCRAAGLKIFRPTAISSSSLISLTTQPITSLDSPGMSERMASSGCVSRSCLSSPSVRWADLARCRRCIEALLQQAEQIVLASGGWASRSLRRVFDSRARAALARGLVRGGDADDLVPFLEGVGGTQYLLVERGVEGPFTTLNVGEEILARANISESWCRGRRSGLSLRQTEACRQRTSCRTI